MLPQPTANNPISFKKIFLLGGAITALVTPACITVNVHFPESAVQEAADDYVKKLYEKRAEQEAKRKQGHKSSSTWKVQDLFIRSAYAGTPHLKTQSTKTKTITDRQVARLEQMNSFKRKKLIGETNEGLLAIRTKNRLLIKKVKPLVDKENQDRNALYEEILRLNGKGHTEIETIRKTFSNTYKNDRNTTWYQTSEGKWKLKR